MFVTWDTSHMPQKHIAKSQRRLAIMKLLTNKISFRGHLSNNFTLYFMPYFSALLIFLKMFNRKH